MKEGKKTHGADRRREDGGKVGEEKTVEVENKLHGALGRYCFLEDTVIVCV